MIFIDTNVMMYAVGRPHPLQRQAHAFFDECQRNGTALFTSAEVLQELAHAYLPVNRKWLFDEAVEILGNLDVEIWPLEAADVTRAAELHEQHPNLSARDLCHLASCRRRGISQIMTFDRNFAAAAARPETTPDNA